ncbi:MULTISPECIES: class I SAM-dependent methyltransferase [unclassified Moritella]|uniref:class I SAM-dependent methyltransferase n=1 Tax=unclassified Moritella TaxID=2637987 RepID=UPI001BED8063|nr:MULTISPECIES: class I SAM-dependent methyltransferase [unclassified Moritella]QUM86834.1 class I SAM-dependent methyltransferase [Moritella sp. 28]QUM91062.1 class I SAM-dependent methyltransferase [Moritella sp. 36]
MNCIQIITTDSLFSEHIAALAKQWGFSLEPVADAQFQLIYSDKGLELFKLDEPKLGSVYVDFAGGAVNHRRKFGGGKGQAIAKAVGLKSGVTPSVVDGTAGLGRDAFVLASLGCHVTMLERSPIVAALLDDGLKRAVDDAEIGGWIGTRLKLVFASSLSKLEGLGITPDVVYLDPMYPHKKKSALVKKEMRVFQSLVGADLDADGLFEPAMRVATKRVVVKRPDYAEYIANAEPSMAIETKKNRFDVYVKQGMK